MAEWCLLNAGGQIRDERHPEHLHTALARRDRLERRRHPDDVSADSLRHLHFGGSLIVWATELAVDALIQARIDRARQVADATRIQVSEVDERCTLER